MRSAIIGHSGFVGSTLQRQTSFEARYRSTDIRDIEGQAFDRIVCAGAPAQKWIANREPEADRLNLQSLMNAIEKVTCGQFVLISTVDVFAHPVGVDETTPVTTEGLHAYGAHRLALEQFVARRFPGALIVRLPGLVGRGLRKNVLFDLLNDNRLDLADSRDVYQFYPMSRLWQDLGVALEHELELLHLTAAPLGVGEIAREAFGLDFEQHLDRNPAGYDFRSVHAELFGENGSYPINRSESLNAIRDYAEHEPRTPTGETV